MGTLVLERTVGADVFTTYPITAERTVAAGITTTATLHPAVLKIAAAAYAVMVGTFWVGFVSSGMLAVAMGIVTVCLVAYLGVPWSMAIVARRFNNRIGSAEQRPTSFRRFLAGHFETGAGDVTGFEAMVLVITVPVCLLGAAIAFAVIYNTLA